MISLDTIKHIVAQSNPAAIPDEFIVGARIITSDGEVIEMDASEMKDYIKTNSDKGYRISLATDVGAFRDYIVDAVQDVIQRVSDQ